MNIKFDKTFRDSLKALDLSEKGKEKISSAYSWTDEVSFDMSEFCLADLDMISQLATEKGAKGITMLINSYKQMVDNVGGTKIRSLDMFATALKLFVNEKCTNRWMYKWEESQGVYLPYLITSIRLIPERNNVPPAVVVNGAWNGYSEKPSIDTNFMTFSSYDVRGKTIEGILIENNLVCPTEELLKETERQSVVCKDFRKRVHEQFLCTGKCKSGRWNNTVLLNNTKCVCEEDMVSRSMCLEYDVRQGIEDTTYPVPVHPYVYVYSLTHHTNFYAHVNELTLYEYDKTLKDKLVLPSEHRDLLDILVDDASILSGDIIQGKSGGTTILCAGGPGLGKTLTAECYSEICEKPLFRIDAGQLGTSAGSVEERLGELLKRAERWGSVTLIDEADTYIRKRGEDIEQNAIVAAFLRTLEYFNGILFMTTNRYQDVDDAITSRCIATIQYEVPDEKSRFRIWKVLSTQLNVEITDEHIATLVAMFPEASGRDIKELLKLTGRYIHSKDLSGDDVIDAFRKCAQFRAIKCVSQL